MGELASIGVARDGRLGARLEALIWANAASADLVIICEADGRLLWLNRFPPGSGEAPKPGAEAALLFPPEARAQAREVQRQVLETRSEGRFEWGQRTSAGIKAWYTCSVTPLQDGAGVAGLLYRSTDLTALKQSEEQLRLSEALMVDTQGVAHLGIWQWDITQPTATWSEELYRIYGLTPETYAPSYEAYLTKVHPDDRARVMEATSRVFHEHIPYSHDERVFRPDGTMRYLHTWARPVLDEAGNLVKLVGVCQDITDRKVAEEQVLELNRGLEQRIAERTSALERSLKDLEAFNAIVTHDLRNPLNTLDLACAVLERKTGELSATSLEVLARMRRASKRMSELIRDLLTLSRVGHVQLGRESVDLGAIASEIIAGFLRMEPQRRVEVHIADGLLCRGDPGLLRAALENLLSNAWKYSAKVPEAVVEVGTLEREGRRAFFVRDNGAGFDMSEAHKLFKPFERLHKPSEFEGTGVGLAAVHRILERHGGRVWAEALPGRGATFLFELP